MIMEGTVTMPLEAYKDMRYEIEGLHDEILDLQDEINRVKDAKTITFTIGGYSRVYTDLETTEYLTSIIDAKESQVYSLNSDLNKLKSRNLWQRIINKPV
jgi:hypothetical protein